MPHPSTSQSTSSRASSDTNSARLSTSSHRSNDANPSSSSNRLTATSKQQGEDEEAAARRARRRKRREDEAYQVRGWENLYRGDGSKPVFAHDPKPSSRIRAAASSSQSKSTTTERTITSSSQPLASTSRASPSSSRQDQTPIKPSSTTPNRPPPPSPAPSRSFNAAAHATTSKLLKRKGTSPSSQPNPKRSAKVTTSSHRQPAAGASDEDSSDDGFEILGVSGPAAPRSHGDQAPVLNAKASPSSHRGLKSSQPTQFEAHRRSAIRASSAGRSSPVPARLFADTDGSLSESGPSSRTSPQRRASRAPSSAASTGPTKLTPEDIEALKQTAYDAFIQGTSLACHIDGIVRDYADMISPYHPDRPKVEQFQQQLADLGQELTVGYLREVMPTLPARLLKRFGPALAAYIQYLKRDWSDAQAQSNDGTSVLDPTVTERIAANAGTDTVASANASNQTEAAQNPIVVAVPSSPSRPAVEETVLDEAPDGTSSHPAIRASDHVFDQAARESSPNSAGADAEPMDIDPHNESETAPGQVFEVGPVIADASHDSAFESASSLQVFGTPPEQPEEEVEEGNECFGAAGLGQLEAEPQEHQILDQLRHSVDGEEQRQRSKQQQDGQEEFSQFEDDEDRREQESKERQQHQPSQESNLDEEGEDELADELDEVVDEQNESNTNPQAREAEQVAPEGETSVVTDDGVLGTPPTGAFEQEANAEEGGVEAQKPYEDDPRYVDHPNGDAPHGCQTQGGTGQQPTTADANDEMVGTDGTLNQAGDSSEAPAPTGHTNDCITDELGLPAHPMADTVATADEAVEQALAVESKAHPAVASDEAVPPLGIVAAADSPTQVDNDDADSSHQDPASDGSSLAAAASEARTVATPLLPSRSNTAEAAAEAQAATSEPSQAFEANAPHAEMRALPLSAATAAVPSLKPASTAAEDDSTRVDQTSEASVEPIIAQEDDSAHNPGSGNEPDALVIHAAAVAEPRHNMERASTQATSDSTKGARPKKTIDDRMKSMLKDLSDVTGRRSSYRTIQKYKPLRAGSGTRKIIQDLVEHWQDPAKLIPWTCLKELGPSIFHKNAHKHMHLSVHELTDKVSNTRSVQHLARKVPERVLTRALMEFPRIPHMLHCWNKEKTKYFASRGLPQPTDTKPEFRFADVQAAENSSGPKLLGVPDANSRASATRNWPLLAQATAQSRAVVPSTIVQPQQANTQATMASYISGPSEQVVAAHPVVAAPPQALTQVGSQFQGAHLARTAATAPGYAAQHSPAMPTSAVRPFPPPQQPAFQPNMQQQRAPGMVQGQQQQQAISDNVRQAAMVKDATDRVFSGLAADCLSFAEHVIGSPASDELVRHLRHFSEADVLHVINFVADTYKREVEAERSSGQLPRCVKAAERYSKVLRVRAVATEVLMLTQMLFRVKRCLNEAAIESLRTTGVASSERWLELLDTAPKWAGVKQHLLKDERALGVLSRAESRMLLQRQVDRLNKRLEARLESLMSMDEIMGGRLSGEADQEEQAAQEAVRKECAQIGRICCKHVVGTLGESEP
ncbi:hypothetical protein EX895_003040 [Sporisorium graminicola]|uniref:Uncharacterized protein n=1 Tax=Sporisorium graminicola TaxID=280036 RepID=A0A4U7KTP9_9BASI|nr:hypothetical protein EX895_003040 [Sporisorium graminicola]TKY87944.1 hypothetical protein EX895_003040 [Sporisorium graminicola]